MHDWAPKGSLCSQRCTKGGGVASGLVARREPSQPQAAGRRLPEAGHALSLLYLRTLALFIYLLIYFNLSLNPLGFPWESEKGLWGWTMGTGTQPQLSG